MFLIYYCLKCMTGKRGIVVFCITFPLAIFILFLSNNFKMAICFAFKMKIAQRIILRSNLSFNFYLMRRYLYESVLSPFLSTRHLPTRGSAPGWKDTHLIQFPRDSDPNPPLQNRFSVYLYTSPRMHFPLFPVREERVGL